LVDKPKKKNQETTLDTYLESEKQRKEISIESDKPTRESVLFRNMIPEIPTTTFGTFSIYKYPAKFIPQVVAFALKKYCRAGMKVFDPFAGYGTTGLVSRVYGHDYELWDLNPIMKTIHDSAIIKRDSIDLPNTIKEIKQTKEEFIPKWSNLTYWFPEEFLPILSKIWGYIHSVENLEIRHLLTIPMLKVTRYFSWSDEKVHKLYKSKFSKQKMEKLLKGNYRAKIYTQLEREIRVLLKKIREFKRLKLKSVKYKIRTGVDALETQLDTEADLLVTSPPYLQAQEYIRSTKLELFWLGFEESYIQQLSKKEIPYQRLEKIKVNSNLFYKYRERIKDLHVQEMYDRYFHAILKIFQNLSIKVTEYLCIFVGPAKVRNISVPIDEIISEHLCSMDWKHEITYIDQIVSRVMFQSEINPATGLKDSRMKTEHLLVLKRSR